MKLKEVEENEELRNRWYSYLDMIDDVILEGLLHAAGCRYILLFYLLL